MYKRRRKHKRNKRAWQRIAGILLMLLVFSTTIVLEHDIRFWQWKYTVIIMIFLYGYMLYMWPIFQRLKQLRPNFFINQPLQWLKIFFLEIIVVLCGLALYWGCSEYGVSLNKKLQEYLLSEQVGFTDGVILGEQTFAVPTKHGQYTESFYMVAYTVDGKLKRQGISKAKYRLKGATYKVTYSKAFPSIIRVGERTFNEKK